MLKRFRTIANVQESILTLLTCGNESLGLLNFLTGDHGRKGAKFLEYGAGVREVFDVLFEIFISAGRPQGSLNNFLHL